MSITSLRTAAVPIRVYDIINIRRIYGLVLLEVILAEMRKGDSGVFLLYTLDYYILQRGLLNKVENLMLYIL